MEKPLVRVPPSWHGRQLDLRMGRTFSSKVVPAAKGDVSRGASLWQIFGRDGGGGIADQSAGDQIGVRERSRGRSTGPSTASASRPRMESAA